VYDKRKARIIASVLHNNIVPTLKIGVLVDEVWESIPLVLGSKKPGATRAEVVEGWVGLDEIVGGPLEGGIFSRNEGRITKSSGVGLRKM